MANNNGKKKNHSVFWSCFWAIAFWSMLSAVTTILLSMHIGHGCGGRRKSCNKGGRWEGKGKMMTMNRRNNDDDYYYDDWKEDDYY